MNINAESHFSELPSVDIDRSIMDLSHGNKTSGNVGDLLVGDCIEVLPGDTFKIKTSKVIRLQTLLTPVMDNMWCDSYWFFVPYRLVWDHWKEFCGENTSSPWIPNTSYSIPSISSPVGGFATNSLADYFHYPVGVQWNATDVNAPSALPFRAYALICNEFFRDQNVTYPLNIPTGDTNQTGTNGTNYINDVANGGMPFKAAKAHDYFTSCLPAPQKGPSVDFNLISGTDAPVYSLNKYTIGSSWPRTDITSFQFKANVGGTSPADYTGAFTAGMNGNSFTHTSVSNASVDGYPTPSNLWADLSSSLGSVTVNELRLAFQLQKFYEKMSLAGSRYTEICREMFGTVSPDGRLQRPEYLGGNRVPIQIHQVANSAQTSTDFLGDVGALSVTGDTSYDVEKSFTEHGLLLHLFVLRYSHSYCQGIPRFALRKDFTDFYLPVFANIGNMPVKDCQIYADATTIANDSVFGFQEAWASYRYLPDSLSGEMRTGILNTLSSWHFGDDYNTKPTLSDGWIREDKANVDRVLAVQSSNANQFFADFEYEVTATRPMPVYSIPGLIDHH